MKEKIQHLIKALCVGLYEREEAVKLALLSAIAGESIFLLGPPGVGKSLVARRLKHAFSDGKSFEYLMTKFSTPDEVFGPISIRKLKDEDKYERLTERYLPGANIVFLDEIWKSSSAIQNALLTILNEKIYRNGEEDIKVDIKGILTASNELPPQGESFDPLWDRMLIRYQMDGIKRSKNFLRMITETKDVYEVEVPAHLKITNQELEEWGSAIDEVEVADEVLNVIQIVRNKIVEHNESNTSEIALHAYDRRWKKIIRLLRTSAFMNGRSYCDLMDAFLMVHCLWNEPHQLKVVQEMVAETIRKHGYSLSINLNAVRKELEEFEKEVEDEIKIKNKKAVDVLKPHKDLYYQLQKDHSKFVGNYIEVKAFNQLSHAESQVTNLFDEELNLVNRLDASKGDAPHTVKIKHNSVEYTVPLETHQTEKIEILHKRPHPLVKKHWDEHYENLMDYVNEQLQYIEQNKPNELKESRFNLFIDERLSGIVEANMNEVNEKLKQMKLRLEKLRHSYEQLN